MNVKSWRATRGQWLRERVHGPRGAVQIVRDGNMAKETLYHVLVPLLYLYVMHEQIGSIGKRC